MEGGEAGRRTQHCNLDLQKLWRSSQGASVLQHMMFTVLCCSESPWTAQHQHFMYQLWAFNQFSLYFMLWQASRDIALMEMFSFNVTFPIYLSSKQTVEKQSLKNRWSRLLHGSWQLKEQPNQVAAMPLQGSADRCCSHPMGRPRPEASQTGNHTMRCRNTPWQPDLCQVDWV